MRFARRQFSSLATVHQIVLLKKLTDFFRGDAQHLSHLPKLPFATKVEQHIAQIEVNEIEFIHNYGVPSRVRVLWVQLINNNRLRLLLLGQLPSGSFMVYDCYHTIERGSFRRKAIGSLKATFVLIKKMA